MGLSIFLSDWPVAGEGMGGANPCGVTKREVLWLKACFQDMALLFLSDWPVAGEGMGEANPNGVTKRGKTQS